MQGRTSQGEPSAHGNHMLITNVSTVVYETKSSAGQESPETSTVSWQPSHRGRIAPLWRAVGRWTTWLYTAATSNISHNNRQCWRRNQNLPLSRHWIWLPNFMSLRNLCYCGLSFHLASNIRPKRTATCWIQFIHFTVFYYWVWGPFLRHRRCYMWPTWLWGPFLWHRRCYMWPMCGFLKRRSLPVRGLGRPWHGTHTNVIYRSVPVHTDYIRVFCIYKYIKIVWTVNTYIVY
jgi:hypothetical protein